MKDTMLDSKEVR